MRLLSRADALIIYMRSNGGGSPETVAHLLGYLLDGDAVHLFTITPRYGEPVSYETPAGLGVSSGRRPLFVLTSPRTFSAGEGLAFLLQQRQRAQIVGERTAGAANPGRPYPVNDLFEVTVPNGRLGSAVDNRNWEGTGVTPDVFVAAEEALAAAHARARAALAR
jgi:C-terminal processing protease CtpA/Prc